MYLYGSCFHLVKVLSGKEEILQCSEVFMYALHALLQNQL